MPRFPVYERRAGLAGGTTGSPASAPPFQARGGALQSLGGAVEGLGEAFAAPAGRMETGAEEAWFSRARARTGLDLARRQSEGADPAALIATLDEATARRTGEAPSERAAALLGEWSLHARAGLAADATRARAGEGTGGREADLAEALAAHLEAARLGGLDAAHARARDDLHGARRWMDAGTLRQREEEIDRGFRLVAAERAAWSDPQGFLDRLEDDDARILQGLSEDERGALVERARSLAGARRRDAGGERLAGIARASRETAARIAAGDPLVTARTIESLGLAERDARELHRALEARQARNAQVEATFRRLGEGAPFDARDADERLAVSGAYEAAARGGDPFDEADGTARDTALYLAGATGIVPEGVLRALRGHLASGDPARIAQAATLAAELHEANPQALSDAGAADVATIGAEYGRLTGGHGLAPRQAGERISERLAEKAQADAGPAGPEGWSEADEPDADARSAAAGAAFGAASAANVAGTAREAGGLARLGAGAGVAANALAGAILLAATTRAGGRSIEGEYTFGDVHVRLRGFEDELHGSLAIENRATGETVHRRLTRDGQGDWVTRDGVVIVSGRTGLPEEALIREALPHAAAGAAAGREIGGEGGRGDRPPPAPPEPSDADGDNTWIEIGTDGAASIHAGPGGVEIRAGKGGDSVSGPSSERFTVSSADGGVVTVENSGEIQKILAGDGRLIVETAWEGGPKILRLSEPLSPEESEQILGRCVALWNYEGQRLEDAPDRELLPVLALKTGEFRGARGTSLDTIFVGQRSAEEIEPLCRRLPGVQSKLDEITAEVDATGAFAGRPRERGTRIHKLMADWVNSHNNADFRAEITFTESGQATEHHFKGSKFLDIFEQARDGTICIYDHKTGKEGLTVERMRALAATAARLFPDKPITTILVIEMRPR